MESAKRERVKVDSGSLIYVDRNAYSVHSRLIGEQVEARLTMDLWRSGTGSARWRNCRGCAAGASIASTTGTSSTGWCASPARLRTTGIATSCFRPAGSAWRSMCLRSSCGPRRAAKNIWSILELAAKESEARWIRLCGRCLKQADGEDQRRADRGACCNADASRRRARCRGGGGGSSSLRSAVLRERR